MRVVFAGTPDFSVSSLQALIDSGSADVVGVYTQPDRPAGRGKKRRHSPVKELAKSSGMEVFQPLSLRSDDAVEQLSRLQPDLVVVTAYGLLFPPTVLDIPLLGCVNIHASLLPRWRGAAPIQRAIEAGDSETGISLMQMEEGLDTGPVLASAAISIDDHETGGSLHHRLAGLGGELLRQNLESLAGGKLAAAPQDPCQATYASKLSRAESSLDWKLPAQQLERKIRAFNPWPGCTLAHGSTVIKIIEASYREISEGVAGEVLESGKSGILVATGQGALNLEKLQKPGGKPLRTADFLNGYPVSPGTILEPVRH